MPTAPADRYHPDELPHIGGEGSLTAGDCLDAGNQLVHRLALQQISMASRVHCSAHVVGVAGTTDHENRRLRPTSADLADEHGSVLTPEAEVDEGDIDARSAEDLQRPCPAIGEHGPQLIEDFVMREKIFHFFVRLSTVAGNKLATRSISTRHRR